MKRRALIIYCNNTASGKLSGPPYDNINYRSFLKSNLGGAWRDEEILSLQNPSIDLVKTAVAHFLDDADYTFTIFSGHGYINVDEGNRQYLEVADGDISILRLRTTARRQTTVIDACRGYHSNIRAMLKGFSETYEHFTGDPYNTRQIFETSVMRAEEGWTILYAASRNQTASDTDFGGAYLLSLLKVAENWESNDKKYNILGLNIAHDWAKEYIQNNYETIQIPVMNQEKRINYFPFAVKVTAIYG